MTNFYQLLVGINCYIVALESGYIVALGNNWYF